MPTSLSKSSRRATRTILIPEAAICRANSLPIPDEAPVTSAQGPNLFLSIATVIGLLRSACLEGLLRFLCHKSFGSPWPWAMIQLTDFVSNRKQVDSFVGPDFLSCCRAVFE